VNELINVDPANAGQVFACLGLLEVANLIAFPATGRFHWNKTGLQANFELSSNTSIRTILEEVKEASVEEPDEQGPLWESTEGEDTGMQEKLGESQPPNGSKSNRSHKNKSYTAPVRLEGSSWELILDAWLTPDTRKPNSPFKTWAGQVSSTQSIINLKKSLNLDVQSSDIFEAGVTMRPVGYDCRSAISAFDLGYNYNKISDVVVYPAVDLFAIIGLNHARPKTNDNNYFEYSLWSLHLPPECARAVITGAIPWLASATWRVSVESRGRFKTWTRGELIE